MRRRSALGALVLAGCLLTPGVSADAQQPPSAVPTPAPPRTLLPLPDAGRPVPIPHARPRGLPPVPIPHVRGRGPAPVPMPHVGEPLVPRLEPPRR